MGDSQNVHRVNDLGYPSDRHMSGMIKGQSNKTAPASATNTSPGPNHSKIQGKEGLEMMLSQTTGPDRTDLALSFLKLIGEQHESTRRHRIYYAQMCRESGLTHRQIAEAYGVTEDAVRKMLKRNGGE